jgi:hypothetical protein
MSRLAIVLVATLAASSLACTVKTVDHPVTVTTKQLPEASKPEVVKNAKEVTGESCNRVVLLIIPVGFATAESAYADALSKAPGADTLLNYEARTNMLFITPFYYEVCTEVHGFAISSKNFVRNEQGPEKAM